uniref:Probable quinone oxidoreductase n=1 Tax=Blastobotrys adeninivorans TaxID=409370 RepID=A0A060TAN2_BLAAD
MLHYIRPISKPIFRRIFQLPATPRFAIRPFSLNTMSIPTTHYAIRIHKTGGPEVIQYEEVPVPQIGDNEILVKSEYAGVNFIEKYFREGLYKAELPYTLGREGAGKIVKVGSKVTKFAVGDTVGYLKAGALAEYVALGEDEKIVKAPEGMSTKLLGSILIQGLTAHVLTTESYPVKKDDYVLVHAAAGGTGSLVVQFASQFGAHVIGTTSTKEKADLAKSLGAEHVINYKEEDVAARVKEITGGKGVIASFDSVGKSTFEVSLNSLALHGNLLSFGNASGAVPPVSVLTLGQKDIRLSRPVLFNFIGTPEEWNKHSTAVLKAIADDKLKVTISKTYPLKDFGSALEDLVSGKTTGKLAIEF